VGVGEIAADHGEIAERAQTRSVSRVLLVGLVVVLLVVGAVALLAKPPAPSTGSDFSRAPASSCAGGDWLATAIGCETVFRIGDQAGARVERARIWLTTLGAVKSVGWRADGSSRPIDFDGKPVEEVRYRSP